MKPSALEICKTRALGVPKTNLLSAGYKLCIGTSTLAATGDVHSRHMCAPKPLAPILAPILHPF